MVILLSAISKIFVQYVFSPVYFEGWNNIPLLLLSSAILSFTSFLGTFLLIEKNTSAMFTTTLAGSVVNIIVSIALIKVIGLFAPCIGLIAGFTLTTIIRYRMVKDRFDLKLEWGKAILLLFLFGIVVLVLYYSLIIQFISIIIGLVVFGFANRKIFFQLRQFIYRPIKMKNL